MVTKTPVPELDCEAPPVPEPLEAAALGWPGRRGDRRPPVLTVNGLVNGAPVSEDQRDPEIRVAMRSIWASVAAWLQVSVKPTPPRPVW